MNSDTRTAIRVLVVGAGGASTSMHLPALAALRDVGKVVLSLVSDLDPGRAARAQSQFGFLEKTGDAMGALAHRDIDAVYVFATAQLHYSIGLAALKLGKHVFVEKPIAPSFAQACEMAEVAERGGRIAVGGHNRRFYRAFELLRQRSGALGWQYAEAIFHKPDVEGAVPFGARTWLSANGIHALDALLFMMGGPPEHLLALRSEAGTVRANLFSALMRWPDGGQAAFLCNNHAGARREEYIFHRIGETYRVTDTALIIEKDGASETLALQSTGDGIAAEHQAFVNAILARSDPPHSIRAIAPSLHLAELVEGGFIGKVPTMFPPVGLVAAPQPASGGPKSIATSHASPLLHSIARTLPNYRLVAIEEVIDSPRERTDIVAALLGKSAPSISSATLAKMPRLSVVGVMGLSLAHHSPAQLLAKGVAVVNASAAYADSVAEFTLALAILARRRAFTSHELMRGGGWGSQRPLPRLQAAIASAARACRPLARALGVEDALLRWWRVAGPGHDFNERRLAPGDLRAANVALIGWGAISLQLTQLLTAMNVRVFVFTEHGSERDIRAEGASPVSLREALACDVVSLHRGLTPQTRHFMGAAELAQLRAGSTLINVARGALIEPSALLARLRKGDIYACLDTYDEEPLSPSDPLRYLSNVFLTSHIAGGSADMHRAAAEEVVRKVALHLQGGAAPGISLERLHTMT